MRTPTWGRIEEFCRADGWTEIRSTSHVFYRKVLADGTILETHRSFASDKTMSPGRFMAILRDQLQVNQEVFWEVLSTGRPAPRPAPAPAPEPPAHPLWVVDVLERDFGLSEQEIAALSPDDAQRMVWQHWSKPRQQ